jgi:heme-degrading monooxygenase HmoA
MHIILWQFQVPVEKADAFQSIYSSSGDWAKLFSLTEGYLGTELLQSSDITPGLVTFVTIDRWRSQSDFTTFQQQHAAAYAELDLRCENLTLHEQKIGIFHLVSPGLPPSPKPVNSNP